MFFQNFRLTIMILAIAAFQMAFAQQPVKRNTGTMQEYKNEFLDSLEKVSDEFREKKEEPELRFKMDFTGIDLPTSVDQFKTVWRNEPISQGLSGMCWCFSTTSYLESEIFRLTGQKLKLSELHTVYWEYVEKATRFVRERGDSEFGEGSESNAVIRIWKKYGVVPAEAYTGLQPGQVFHDHRQMYEEMNNYLQFIRENNAWNEDVVIGTIRSILDHYLGKPPQYVNVNGKKMTPQEYLQKVVRINLDDYVDFLSLLEKPFYQKVEFPVEDNWWHSKDYYNIPVEDFMTIVKKSIRNGYSVCIGGDVSESGYNSHKEVAMVPTYDIPANYIDDDAREFRFNNKTTEDDHGIHLVGYMEKDGKDWYLIKDSGSGSRNGPNFGYYFYHEDYVKLKMLSFMIHRDMAEEILAKFKTDSK
jgi:bleomycin hydrolase